MKSDIAYALQSDYPKVKILEVSLEKNDWILGDGIGIRKENIILREQVEMAVSHLKDVGVARRIHSKWFDEDTCCR